MPMTATTTSLSPQTGEKLENQRRPPPPSLSLSPSYSFAPCRMWYVRVIDETAHRVKNMNTHTHATSYSLRAPSLHTSFGESLLEIAPNGRLHEHPPMTMTIGRQRQQW